MTGTMETVAGLGALAAPIIIPLVAGRAFAPSVGVFQLLLLGLIGMSVTTVMGPQWIGRGLLWQTSAITLVEAGLNFTLNCVLVPRYGMFGSVAAT